MSVNIITEDIAKETEKRLKDKGWCFWQCKNLDNDIITVMKDNLTEEEERRLMDEVGIISENIEYKEKWAWIPYKVSELVSIGDVSDLRLIHEAKKLGAVIDG